MKNLGYKNNWTKLNNYEDNWFKVKWIMYLSSDTAEVIAKSINLSLW